ncbi:hypothetical protein EV368DRAFT_75035 [Lentinula lateritia]|nr:hypothetical protein EV368DRAFT_75035 [Lentinula lateritia]
MSNNSYTCSGCGQNYNRSSNLIQHLEKTYQPACQEAYEASKQAIHHSRFMSPVDPLIYHHSQFSSSSIQAHLASQDEEDDPIYPFQGDFFGNDYSNEDFPGFDDDDCEDDENGNEETEADLDPELEPTWEPVREPASVLQEYDEQTTSIETGVDDENEDVPMQDGKSLLRHLPAHREEIHIERFGDQAGAIVVEYDQEHSLPIFHDSKDGFLHYEAHIPGIKENKWAPFASHMDWEIAHWAKLCGTGSNAFSELLAIDGVSEALQLSYKNSDELNSIIDTKLPAQRPAFVRQEVVIAGEALDLYKRPVMECIQALYGSPEHAHYLCLTPEQHYSDANKTNRLYHDMHTGKWWWSTQKQLEKDKPGATIVPIILSSDKTQITLFRNKSAYPVYLTIGNLPKEIRRKPSQQGQILLAYLPTSRLQHITSIANLFHACMGDLLAPLKEAGVNGVVLSSEDGIKRHCHPILAVYIGDYPEQMLVTCSYYGTSPVCIVSKNQLGDYPCSAELRDPVKAVQAAKLINTAEWTKHCSDADMKPIQHPFWEDLPYTDIFHSITPDILHQMYQGVMKHLIVWITTIVGADEVDARVRRLPARYGIHHFHKGITTLSRMCTFLLSLVTDIPRKTTSQSNRLLIATRALLDFLYLSCYPIHSDESLTMVETSLSTFHANKDIFIELGAREHFNFPKIHYLCHFVPGFKLFGTSDNYNTETTERLHIDFTKDAYRASNRKDEYSQMTKWLERREKVVQHTNYLSWCKSQRGLNPQSIPFIIPGVHYDFPGSQRSLQDMQCSLTHVLTKFPTQKMVSFSKLMQIKPDQQGYGACNFEYALKMFIVQHSDPQSTTIGQIEDMTTFLSLLFQSVPVWHRIKFRNEDLYGTKTLDVVAAHPRRYNSHGQITQIFQFDAALIQVQPKVDASNLDFLQGLQVGRIRVIFSIPSQHLACLILPKDIVLPTHVAYVECGLYRVKPLFNRDGSRAASVISVEMIQQSVHLYPKWGGVVPSIWSYESVLDQSPSFLVSPFTDIHTYFNMS